MRDSAWSNPNSETVLVPATLNADLPATSADPSLVKYLDLVNIGVPGFGEAGSGSWDSVAEKVALAKKHGVKVGVLASSASTDPSSFRTEILAQLGALSALARAAGADVNHVKLAPAACTASAGDRALADALAGAGKLFGLPIVGLPGTEHEAAAKAAGVTFIPEWYPDAEYDERGLVTGSAKQAGDVTDRVQTLMRSGKWTAAYGRSLFLPKDAKVVTISLGPNDSSEIAAAIREAIDTC